MQAHREFVAPAARDDHVDASGQGKGGVLSKVKYKARKLKNKVKNVTSSNPNEHAQDADKHDMDKECHMYTRGHEIEDVEEDSDQYDDDYDHEQEDDNMNHKDNQCEDKQLHSVYALDDHDDGAGWKNPNDNTPASIYKSGEPTNTLHTVPTEPNDYATDDNNQLLKEGNSSYTMKLMSPINPQLDRAYSEYGQSHASPIYDQIGIMSEDLSADRKLGIADRSAHHASDGRENMSTSSFGKRTGLESPAPMLMQDGANESIYRPIFVPDTSGPPLTSQSINASLHGDILTGGNNSNKTYTQAAVDYSSIHSQKELHVYEECLPSTHRPAREQDVKMLQGSWDHISENELGDAGKQQASNFSPGSGRNKEDDREPTRYADDRERSADDSHKAQDSSCGMADKLNDAVDALALKLGSGEWGGNFLFPGESDGDRAHDTSKDSELEEALATTPAANLPIGTIQGLKGTVASKVGIGDASLRIDVPHAENVGPRSLIGEEGKEEDREQSGLLETLKDTVMSALGFGGISSQAGASEDQLGTNEASARPNTHHTSLSSEGSMDVPQAAFL